jgi:hypothetical protein
MNPIRTTYLTASATAREVLGHPEVARRWDEPSTLQSFSIRGLAGHLARAVGSTVAYLDRGDPDGAPITAAAYYAQAVETSDVDAALNVSVRERGEAEAKDGYQALIARYDEMSGDLQMRLETESSDRKVRVYKDLVLLLDEYLVTRIIELLVHTDDLAVSIGIPTPQPHEAAARLAIANLVEVALVRHGDTAVLRALTRRERDAVDALRVI